ncbi:MAG TPA: hypothetical protein VFU03_10170 [Gemmatimonadales bacterium]|nr:hypothetical protein [Gemmatimonadales bacterium]
MKWTRPAPGGRWRTLVGLLPFAVAACSLSGAGHSLGTGLVKGVKSDRDTLAVATQPAVDSFTFRLTRDIRDSLRPELLSLIAAAGDTAKLKADSIGQVIGDRLQAAVAKALRDSLSLLVSNTNADLRDAVRSSLRVWLDELMTRARNEGSAAVGAIADSAIGRGAIALSIALRGPLRDSLLALIHEAADTAGKGAATVSKSFTDRAKDLLKTVGGKVLLGGIILLALGGGVLWWLFAKRQKMLAVMTTAIEHLGSEQLKQNIQQQATASNVEGSLHRYLKRRGMS